MLIVLDTGIFPLEQGRKAPLSRALLFYYDFYFSLAISELERSSTMFSSNLKITCVFCRIHIESRLLLMERRAC